MAADLRATSAEHLLRASNENIRAMAGAGVIGILLPATAYCLQKEYAPARKMVELGLPIAIATDCNPGTSYTESMPFVFGLSVLGMHLSISEALVASTLNAAYSIGMSDRAGSLDVGKSADFIILDGDSPAIVAYHAGVSPVMRVYKQAEPAGECRECTGGVNSVLDSGTIPRYYINSVWIILCLPSEVASLGLTR